MNKVMTLTLQWVELHQAEMRAESHSKYKK